MFGSGTFTLFCVAYLLWYGWKVFVKDKGNPGGLGMTVAAVAWFEIFAWLLN